METGAGRRKITKLAESRYSLDEGEMLGVVEGLHKAKHFVLGCDKLIVAVDHKPLLGLLNDKSLADIDNQAIFEKVHTCNTELTS